MADLSNVRARPTLETLENGAQESRHFAERLLEDLRSLHAELTNNGLYGKGQTEEILATEPGIIARTDTAQRDTHETLSHCREALDEVRAVLFQAQPKVVAPEHHSVRGEPIRQRAG